MPGLRERWRREQFDPTWLGVLVNPFYFARRGLRLHMAPLLARLEGAVLDVGCGGKPYEELVPGASRYVGLEIDTPAAREIGAADVFYDGDSFPFEDATFDGAICSQVLEHVFTPDRFIGEIGRVLRPGGLLVLTAPFVWDEHEQPRDFGRYSSFGVRALLERGGFDVLELDKSITGVGALAQLTTVWIKKVTQGRPVPVKLAVQLFLIAPVNAVGALLGRFLSRDADLYLDTVVLARARLSE